MSLRNKILLTTTILIITTGSILIYIPRKLISQSSNSHAYSILSFRNNDFTKNIINKINNLKQYAISSMYNKNNKLNYEIFSKLDMINSVYIMNQKKELLLGYKETKHKCSTNYKNLKSTKNNFNVYKRRKKVSYCLSIPFKINDKKYLAVYNIPLNFFKTYKENILTNIIVSKTYEINLKTKETKRFNSKKYTNLIRHGMLNETINFFKTEKFFILTQRAPNTNLTFLSYVEVNKLSSLYKNFIYSSIGLMALIIAIAITILFFIINSFMKPIKKLCLASKKLADGNYSNEINKTKFKELNDLVNNFNIMMEKIKDRENDLSTLNKELEKQVQQKTKELLHTARMASLGTLSSGVAHEFNNTLGAIIGHVSLALEQKNKKKMEDALKIALEASEKACAIVSRLQDFSKKKEKGRKIFSIKKAIENVLSLIEKDFNNFKIIIEKDIKKDFKIKGNKNEIEQVILNLLINSKHAIKDKGLVKIVVKEEKKNIAIYVKDNGIGIPKEVQDRVFEPFFTTKGALGLGKSFNSNNIGTGLGLSVSLGIIQAHNGSIKLEKSTKNETVFKIQLPLS
jgi:signal transduction histidine kinase